MTFRMAASVSVSCIYCITVLSVSEYNIKYHYHHSITTIDCITVSLCITVSPPLISFVSNDAISQVMACTAAWACNGNGLRFITIGIRNSETAQSLAGWKAIFSNENDQSSNHTKEINLAQLQIWFHEKTAMRWDDNSQDSMEILKEVRYDTVYCKKYLNQI